MSEPKFTPGPWHARWEGHPVLFPFVWQEHGHAVAKLCGKPRNPDWIVTRESDYADPEKVLANAALIAAAPEMYECLCEAVKIKCVGSGCHAYNAGECMQADGICPVQNWIKVLKEARGE